MSSNVDVSLVFTPRNGDKLNFEPLMDKLKNENQFTFYKMSNNFVIEMNNQDKCAKFLIYYNGIINYTECINNVDVSPNKINVVFNNCIAVLKFLDITAPYEKNLGVFIKGKDMDIGYENIIREFGRAVFKNPDYRNMNLRGHSIQYSMFIKEKSDSIFEL